MELNEIIFSGTGILFIVLSLIQISPIEINPWSTICKFLGNAFNGQLYEKFDNLANDVNNMREDIHKLEATTKQLEEKIDESDAIACRSRIIRFGDELYHKQKHTKEHFDQILSDITQYQLFCENHTNFKDTIADLTIRQITEAYCELFSDGRFL